MKVWAGCYCRRPTGCGDLSAGTGRRGGARSVAAVCRRRRRCFGILVSSTTHQRRTEGSRTKGSYPQRCVGWTWQGQCRYGRVRREPFGTCSGDVGYGRDADRSVCYKKYKAYQPLCYWAEADQIVHSSSACLRAMSNFECSSSRDICPEWGGCC